MSLFSTFALGVNAASGQSRALGTISNNIANANTDAYKASRTEFASLLTQNAGRPTGRGFGAEQARYHGITSTTRQAIDAQGSLRPTERDLDLAIVGRGFFNVRGANGEVLFSRDGSFDKQIIFPDFQNTQKSELYLANRSGNRLMGWDVAKDPTAAGQPEVIRFELDSLAPELKATATQRIDYKIQLPADAAEGSEFPTGAVFFDGTDSANGRPLALVWEKTATPNQWRLTARLDNRQGQVVGSQEITFIPTPQDSPANAVGQNNQPVPSQLTAVLDNGQEITVDLAESTQYFGPFIPPRSRSDGFPPGDLSDLAFSSDGFLIGKYTNGVEKKLYRLPLSYFQNDNALQQIGGNDFRRTQEAGARATFRLDDPTLTQSQPGSLSVRALEASAVDITREFSSLIQTQRAYQAATRIVQVTDELTRNTTQLKN
jgi:flagellar hook protein FlgE